ncbi:unnamed protein product, partial [Ectocarpus sp. 12 AP-2014]
RLFCLACTHDGQRGARDPLLPLVPNFFPKQIRAAPTGGISQSSSRGTIADSSADAHALRRHFSHGTREPCFSRTSRPLPSLYAQKHQIKTRTVAHGSITGRM